MRRKPVEQETDFWLSQGYPVFRAGFGHSDALGDLLQILAANEADEAELERVSSAGGADGLAAAEPAPVAADQEFSLGTFEGLLSRNAIVTEQIDQRAGALSPPQPTVSETGIRATMGSVSIDTLAADLRLLADGMLNSFGDRVLVGASEGGLAGIALLLVEANEKAGFQYGEDTLLVLLPRAPGSDLSVDFPLI